MLRSRGPLAQHQEENQGGVVGITGAEAYGGWRPDQRPQEDAYVAWAEATQDLLESRQAYHEQAEAMEKLHENESPY